MDEVVMAYFKILSISLKGVRKTKEIHDQDK
jgi:hypothetical protein